MSERKGITSFPLAMMDYFGKNGKETSDFMQELKALTDADKAEFRAMLKEQGYGLP
jgi:uncharacterized protein YcgL (UPF0745 family)